MNLVITKISSASAKEIVDRYAHKLIAEGRNSAENFSALCDYTDWLGQRALYVALIEIMDCDNALEVLAEDIEKNMAGKCVIGYFIKLYLHWDQMKKKDVPILK